LTKFDEKQSHKWSIVLKERKEKIDKALAAIDANDFETANKLVTEVFYGGTPIGEYADPGMKGTLFYHMSMVNKMATEPRLLLKYLKIKPPNVSKTVQKLYDDFTEDAIDLAKKILPLEGDRKAILRKISTKGRNWHTLYKQLVARADKIKEMLKNKNPKAKGEIQKLFQEWAQHNLDARLQQEYETIKGAVTMVELAKKIGMSELNKALSSTEEKFGEETTEQMLKSAKILGIETKEMPNGMLSDHFLDRKRDMMKMEGYTLYLNCPIYGSYTYIEKALGTNYEVLAPFCKHLCYGHAKAMLQKTMPFNFDLKQSKIMLKDGKCEYLIKIKPK
jgi:hypothetical protein